MFRTGKSFFRLCIEERTFEADKAQWWICSHNSFKWCKYVLEHVSSLSQDQNTVLFFNNVGKFFDFIQAVKN